MSVKIEPLGFPWKTRDPFLFCAFHKDDYPASNGKMGPADSLTGRMIGQDFQGKDGWNMYHGKDVPGFPTHPHRGFETITIAKEGMVDHSDSLGAAGRFGNGDVQWMTAGKGVQHSEMFPLLKQDAPNPLLLFQIWLNLPASSKLVEPYFGMIWNENILKHRHTDENGNETMVEIVCGNLADNKVMAPAPDSWASNPANEVAVWTIKMAPGAQWTVPGVSEGTNRALYFYSGNMIEVDGKEALVNSSIEMTDFSDISIKNGNSESHFLYLQGKPINEPVAQYGPFVMNSQSEIQQAITEFQQTQFGGWPWDTNGPTHGADKGRFALFPDGKEEIPQ